MDEIRATIEREIEETGLRIEYAASWIFGENTTKEVNAYIEIHEQGLVDIPNKTFWLKAHFAISDTEKTFNEGDLCKSITRLNDANYFLGCAEHYQQNTDEARNKQKKSRRFTEGNKEKAIEFWRENSKGKGLNFKFKKDAAKYMNENLIVNATISWILDDYLKGL